MTLRHVRSTNFIVEIEITEENGSPVDLTGWTLTSEIRVPGVAGDVALTIVPVNLALGQIRIEATPTQTDLWVPTTGNNLARFDVRARLGGVQRVTEPYLVEVIDYVTDFVA
jgi:hypothetical protein